MREWVKIHESEKYGQLLVENSVGDTGLPIIRISGWTQGGEYVSSLIEFGNEDVEDDEDFENLEGIAKEVFERIGVIQAEGMMDKVVGLMEEEDEFLSSDDILLQ